MRGVRSAFLLLLCCLLTAGSAAATELPERFSEWLSEVEPVMLSRERQVFLRLKTDYQREAFIDRFWRVRDPYPQSAKNEFKVRFERRVEQAKALYGRLADDRSRIYLVHGDPAGRLQVSCSASYKPVEVWRYEGSEQVEFSINLIFLVPRDGGAATIWHPEHGEGALRNSRHCVGGDQVLLAASTIRANGLDWELGFQRMLAKPRPNSSEWLATFSAFTTDLPPHAETFDAALSFGFPGRYQQRTVTQGMIAVPVTAVAPDEVLGFTSYDFDLVGEVVLNGRLFESFRYKFAFPAEEFAGTSIPLAFQRYLRPGDYTLVLRLADRGSGRFFRRQLDLTVPTVDESYLPATVRNTETVRLFAEATAAVARGETSIRIVPPRSILQTGFVRFDTLAVGGDIAKVAFILDEKRLLTRTRPPYNVEIDLGDYPRPHTLRVEALGASGEMVAWDEIEINAASQRFAVRLLEPRRGVTYDSSLLATARVDVPDGRSLQRLELYLNDKLMATLYQPPFSQPMAVPPSEELTYVRAVAHLPDGTTAEDLVFLNTPDHFDSLDVQVVELYTAVLDRAGRPVLDLEREDFTVHEDKVPQDIIKFESVGNRPIHAGILFDNSASMGPLLDYTRVAALTFFRDALTPRDRAAVITFNRLPRLAVELTNDLRLLGGGLAGLTAEGETALYDSIMFGLYYFAGIKGQRALILLSDGKDEASRFAFDDTIDYARRAGVTLYAIGLFLNEPTARSKLGRMAEETGGRAFFLEDLAKLPEVYSLIERELRSQYLLTYQSSNTDDDETFRTIRVELSDDDLTPRTLSGYYP